MNEAVARLPVPLLMAVNAVANAFRGSTVHIRAADGREVTLTSSPETAKPVELYVIPADQCDAEHRSDAGQFMCTMTKGHPGPVHVEMDPVFGIARGAWLDRRESAKTVADRIDEFEDEDDDPAAHLGPFGRRLYPDGDDASKPGNPVGREIVEWLHGLERARESVAVGGSDPREAAVMQARRGVYEGVAEDIKRKWPALFASPRTSQAGEKP